MLKIMIYNIILFLHISFGLATFISAFSPMLNSTKLKALFIPSIISTSFSGGALLLNGSPVVATCTKFGIYIIMVLTIKKVASHLKLRSLTRN